MSRSRSDHAEPGLQPSIRLRVTPSEPAIVLTARTQIILGVLIFVISAWLTISTVSYLGSRSLLVDRANAIRDLEGRYAELLNQSRASTAAFIEQVNALEDESQTQTETIAGLESVRGSLERQLASRERQIARLADERSEAREMLAELEQAHAGGEAELSRLIEQRRFLAEQLSSAQARLAQVMHQRDTGRRVEHGLRWEVARLKSQIESRAQTAELWFEDWVANSVGSLEKVFRDTGVDLEGLIARASEQETAQGGPFQGIEPSGNEPGLAEVDPLARSIRRLTALQHLTSTLPLASPLDHFHITSGFGKRRDPFTSKWAFHSGLDLGAARGSEVLATAPGVVVTAGPYGPYGNMVEIDHGMGITTRYGHLESTKVQVGDEVQFRQPVGVIGNTGRSTARHLHYEVRIDDEAYNPSNFLEAGRYLVDVFNYRQYVGTPDPAG